MKYWCNNCEHVFEYTKPPQDLSCENIDCWGEKLIEYTGQDEKTKAGKKDAGAQPPKAMGIIEGLCLLVCDASFSMDEKAFPHKEPSKLKIVTRAVYQAVTELYRISKPAEAFIGIIAFGARAVFVSNLLLFPYKIFSRNLAAIRI